MSDILNKKVKSKKTHGWEEAGAEFYQENYNSEWDVLPKDDFQITTLLPSKQSRIGTYKRIHHKPSNIKQGKCMTQYPSSYQQTYQRNDVQLSTLPDLSQVFTDEERIWEEILQIKLLPIPMAHKKDLKANLQNATKLRLQGISQLKWKHRKIWQRIRFKWSELSGNLELWQSSLRQVEGHFGTGVVAYFRFLRWLFFLNCITFTLILIFIILPTVLLNTSNEKCCETNATTGDSSDILEEQKDEPQLVLNFLDIIKHCGYFKYSLLFYGSYTTQELSKNNETGQSSLYNLRLAYISTIIVCFFFTLITIVRATAREFKDPLINGKWQFYQYCNIVFGAWDFCIYNKKSSEIKHNAVYNEIKNSLQSKHIEFERINRSRNYMYRLIFIRIIINILVAVILLISAYLLYVLLNMSLHHENVFDITDEKNQSSTIVEDKYATYVYTDKNIEYWKNILIEYVPYIVIVSLNLLLPIIFNYLCQFEQYTPFFVMKISLFRTVFLRLASLTILLCRFYYIVIPQSQKNQKNSSRFECWESFVGEQFFKLLLTDFMSQLIVTFCINFPRAICARNMKCKILKFIGEQEFELPKHVLDVIYMQTICWLGCFYSPFLPLFISIIIFFIFYIKKFQCLVNSKPSKLFYGVSRSNSLFMLILLISYFVAVIPLTFAITEIMPSIDCGPFKGLYSVWEVPYAFFMSMPAFVQKIILFFGSASFSVPCFLILLLCLYYFHAVSDANKNMVIVLKNQLALEGHDKQFLLNRLSIFLKQYHDKQETSPN